jgi:hypothetical protein
VRGHPPAYAPAQRAPPARWHAPPALGPLDAFVRQWDLNAEARAFLGDLPEDVSASVFRGFNAKGTKDVAHRAAQAGRTLIASGPAKE